ncbi:hypothetical protein K438DRAFT_1805001 [Mycena galopus ATCC 62051]|nr:hypothetical protein K438DRAFT_1805001 [Mycena galopus ATCC 62051]
MMEAFSSPILPTELEREIFELCALSGSILIPKVMLVAKRVKEWVEPLLYRAIIVYRKSFGKFTSEKPPTDSNFTAIADDVLSSISRRKPSAFFHRAVRYLRSLTLDVQPILTLCTGSLPLKRIYVKLMPPITPRPFSCLTHLHLGHSEDVESTCAILTALPKLAHLSLVSRMDDTPFVVSHKALDSSRIRVLVLFYLSPAWTRENLLSSQLKQDARFVVMRLRNLATDWYARVQLGANDYWADAENHIAKRRIGEIDRERISWASK